MRHLDEPILAIAEIRRNSDGVVHQYEIEFHGSYIWEEGNFSCDCNRAIFWNDDGVSGYPCGEGAFTLRLIAKDDGRVLYQDDAW